MARQPTIRRPSRRGGRSHNAAITRRRYDTAATDTLRRRYLGRRRLDANPKVEPIFLDDKPAVEVALSGRHGVGKKMILDAETWSAVRDDYGAG